MLRRLGDRKPALVELLPLGPRERDRRWRHLIGDGSERETASSSSSSSSTTSSSAESVMPAAAPLRTVEPPRVVDAALEGRVAALEREVAALRDELNRLRSPHMGD